MSPTILFQVVQPMSDVPATVCWLAALLLAFRATPVAAAGAGALASLATLIRPNLAPLVAIVGTALLWPRPVRLRRAAAFAFILAVWCAYLPYVSFRQDEWLYTRFLLPALPMMLLFATAIALWGLRRLPGSSRLPALIVLVLGLVGYMSGSAARHGAFKIRAPSLCSCSPSCWTASSPT